MSFLLVILTDSNCPGSCHARKYNHIGILKKSLPKQVASAPERVWGVPNFISKLKFL